MVVGFPVGYAAAAPAYNPNVYPGANPAFSSGKNIVYLTVLWSLFIYRYLQKKGFVEIHTSDSFDTK